MTTANTFYHIVFHRADLDGIGSCMVVLKHLFAIGATPDFITLHGWNYGEPAPTFDDGVRVIIVDCSFTVKEMLTLSERDKVGDIHVQWIDHHKTAYDDSVRHNYDLLGGIRSLNRPAAIMLAWDFFFGGDAPLGIKWLSTYDVWDDSDAFMWKDAVMPFQYGMRHQNWLAKLYDAANDTSGSRQKKLTALVSRFFNLCHDDTDSVLDEGRIILAYQQVQNEIASARAFPFRFNDTEFAVINQGGGNSAMFVPSRIKFPYEAVMTFSFDGRTMKWKFSMYGVNSDGKKSEIDLSVIAKKMGGGGHAGACGFEVISLQSVFPSLHEGPGIAAY